MYRNIYGNNLKIFFFKYSVICFYVFVIYGRKCEIWFGFLRFRINYINILSKNNFGY